MPRSLRRLSTSRTASSRSSTRRNACSPVVSEKNTTCSITALRRLWHRPAALPCTTEIGKPARGTEAAVRVARLGRLGVPADSGSGLRLVSRLLRCLAGRRARIESVQAAAMRLHRILRRRSFVDPANTYEQQRDRYGDRGKEEHIHDGLEIRLRLRRSEDGRTVRQPAPSR